MTALGESQRKSQQSEIVILLSYNSHYVARYSMKKVEKNIVLQSKFRAQCSYQNWKDIFWALKSYPFSAKGELSFDSKWADM